MNVESDVKELVYVLLWVCLVKIFINLRLFFVHLRLLLLVSSNLEIPSRTLTR